MPSSPHSLTFLLGLSLWRTWKKMVIYQYMEDYNNINFLINVVCCFLEASMTIKMQSFTDSSTTLVQNIHNLSHSRELAKNCLNRLIFGSYFNFKACTLECDWWAYFKKGWSKLDGWKVFHISFQWNSGILNSILA